MFAALPTQKARNSDTWSVPWPVGRLMLQFQAQGSVLIQCCVRFLDATNKISGITRSNFYLTPSYPLFYDLGGRKDNT